VFASHARALEGNAFENEPRSLGYRNGYWMPCIVVDEGVPFDWADALARFKQANIDGRVFFWPLSMLPMFDDSWKTLSAMASSGAHSTCRRITT
jgi:perosamine synthetase